MKVVIDTNVLLQVIGKKSKHYLRQSYLTKKFSIAVTVPILFEYEEKLLEKTSPFATYLILRIITEANNTIFTEVAYYWNAIKDDSDDNKFFDAAFAANADYLVTNDAHFNVVKKFTFPKINIISADKFLEVVNFL